MLFNSFEFLIFFFVVYIAYLALRRNFRVQNSLLLVASYVFYGSWNWRFLFLILLSTVVDYFVGLALEKCEVPRKRKLLLGVSLVSNLSILGFFKYFNFFADSFTELLLMLGMKADFVTLNIILPVGISFYTFQTLSYTFDIYRKRLKPTRNFRDFALFVSFFPQLVAGPIERAANLLPQITRARKISTQEIDAGIFLILWGYFKKVVIADNVGLIADQVFNDYTQFSGLDLLAGILAFTVQIYCDFSGYSDIARGVCKLMGFNLMVNFRLPYFALNPSDFWARWHISLSSWLRDYLYISLGGNRKGTAKTYRNLLVTMLLGGLWHGAAWNFIVWGGFHGTILCLYRIFDRNPLHGDPWSGRHPYWRVVAQMSFMFLLTLIGWVIFRSQSVHQILYILSNVGLHYSQETGTFISNLVFFSTPLLLMQLYQYVSGDLLIVTKLSTWLRAPIYTVILIGILIFGVRESLEFIYFQF